MRYIQVSWGEATFALGIDDAGMVTQTPPIAKWASGKDQATVAAWYKARGATFAQIPEPAAPVTMSPDARFWCEHCNGRHTISQMQRLRAADWPCVQPRAPVPPASAPAPAPGTAT